MRFAVLGAGAIGGFLGARLARAGEDVTLIARGAHLDAMRRRGLTVRDEGGEFTVTPALADTDGPIMKFRKWYSQFYVEPYALPADQGV